MEKQLVWKGKSITLMDRSELKKALIESINVARKLREDHLTFVKRVGQTHRLWIEQGILSVQKLNEKERIEDD